VAGRNVEALRDDASAGHEATAVRVAEGRLVA
jgi:hypothetical protein